MTFDLPTEGTVERWAWDYVVSTSLEHKLSPPRPPSKSRRPPPRSSRLDFATMTWECSRETRRTVLPEEVKQTITLASSVRVMLLAALQHELLERSVPVSSDAANGVLRLSESLLFDSGSATLRPDGERALVQLAAVLLEILPCMTVAPASLARTCPDGPTPLLETLLVEGHTDAEPIHGGGFADNWELATARSIGVFKALIAYAPGLESLRNEHGEVVLGVSGYEARRPVTRASGEEARRLNRRIDLRFVLAGPGAIEIDRLRRRLDRLGELDRRRGRQRPDHLHRSRVRLLRRAGRSCGRSHARVRDAERATRRFVDVREGGLNLSGLFTADRDNITRTPTLSCGPVNAGATGWSIGAYERD